MALLGDDSTFISVATSSADMTCCFLPPGLLSNSMVAQIWVRSAAHGISLRFTLFPRCWGQCFAPVVSWLVGLFVLPHTAFQVGFHLNLPLCQLQIHKTVVHWVGCLPITWFLLTFILSFGLQLGHFQQLFLSRQLHLPSQASSKLCSPNAGIFFFHFCNAPFPSLLSLHSRLHLPT